MTLYGYARVSVREPEDKNLDLQVERLVRAGCAMGNVRAEEASGAKNDRGGLLELLDLVVEGDTLVVTHIDRLSRGLTYGLQVIEGLHHAGVEFRSLSEDFDTATATGKLQLAMVLAFSEWWRNSIRDRSVAGQAKARAEGRFPGRTAQPDRAATGVHPGGAVEGSEPAGTGQAPGGQPLDHPTGGRVESRVGIAASARSVARRSDTVPARAAPCNVLPPLDVGPRGLIRWTRPVSESSWVSTGPRLAGSASEVTGADSGADRAVPDDGRGERGAAPHGPGDGLLTSDG